MCGVSTPKARTVSKQAAMFDSSLLWACEELDRFPEDHGISSGCRAGSESKAGRQHVLSEAPLARLQGISRSVSGGTQRLNLLRGQVTTLQEAFVSAVAALESWYSVNGA
jgi:hypothetical protein